MPGTLAIQKRGEGRLADTPTALTSPVVDRRGQQSRGSSLSTRSWYEVSAEGHLRHFWRARKETP